MVTEEFARETFAGVRAERLCDLVDGAWQDYKNTGIQRRRRARANEVWDNMTRRAIAPDGFASLTGIEAIERNDETVVFLVDDLIVLKLKKHDRESRTRNYRTRVQRRIQMSGTLPDLPGRDLVTCGYRLDAAEAGIEKLVMAHTVGNTVEWKIDLTELAAGVLIPATPIIPGLPPEVAPLPRIARRVKEAESEG